VGIEGGATGSGIAGGPLWRGAAAATAAWVGMDGGPEGDGLSEGASSLAGGAPWNGAVVETAASADTTDGTLRGAASIGAGRTGITGGAPSGWLRTWICTVPGEAALSPDVTRSCCAMVSPPGAVRTVLSSATCPV
jgi:hypothetical protein